MCSIRQLQYAKDDNKYFNGGDYIYRYTYFAQSVLAWSAAQYLQQVLSRKQARASRPHFEQREKWGE